jgi:hypothetical protein
MKEKGEVWQDGTSNAALFQPRVPMVTSSYSDLIRSGKDWQQHYTTVSGALFRHSASLEEPSVSFNPKLFAVPNYSQEPVTGGASDLRHAIADTDFLYYAEQLKQAGAIIYNARPDKVLIPERGGVRLWAHLRIYCNISAGKSFQFPFSGEYKHTGEAMDRLVTEFRPLLGRERLSVVCVDAADGGHGSARLVKILRRIHEYDRKSHWRITLCLFVPEHKTGAKWGRARERSSGPNFVVKANLLGVPKVIGEDMDSGMIEPQNFGRFGRLLIREAGSFYRVESKEIPAVIDHKITEATQYSFATEPFSTLKDIRQVEADETWKGWVSSSFYQHPPS